MMAWQIQIWVTFYTMTTQRLDFTVSIEEAVNTLRRGQLVAFPTETVYGLGADALNVRALEHVYALKGRPTNHPVIVHLAHIDQVDAWVNHFGEAAMALANAFWPGPLTLILPKSQIVPHAVTGGSAGVGLRIPKHPVAQRLLRAFEGGIAAPSANRYGQLSPTRLDHVRAAFGEQCPPLLEGGPSQVGLESTIVDLMDPNHPVVRRPGHITPEELGLVLNKPIPIGGHTPAPGTVKHHYAPHAPLHLMTPQQLANALQALHSRTRIALITPLSRAEGLPDNVLSIRLPSDADGYGRRLYAALHEADALNPAAIWLPWPDEPQQPSAQWVAVYDRLQRAAYATTQNPITPVGSGQWVAVP
jgi:L-threonylcarbamoyladenylate synthase